MNLALLTDQLVRHEGMRTKPYTDTVGKLTIGVGRNLTDVGITRSEAQYLLSNDIAKVEAWLDMSLPWWRQLDDVRQRVLADLCFNLGLGGLLKFKNTLRHWEAGRYEEAAQGLIESKWYGQVKTRGPRLVEMLRTGEDVL